MKHESLLLLLRWLFAGLAVAAVIAYIVRPLLNMVRRKPDVDLNVPDFSHRLEEEELEIPTEETRDFDRQSALEQARTDPRGTALRVQKWLKEKR